MSQVIIASQLDEDYNQVIRERLAPLHPEAQVIGVPVGVPSDLPPHANILLLRRSMCGATPPPTPATGLALRRTVGAPGVVGYRLLPPVAIQRPTRDHFPWQRRR